MSDSETRPRTDVISVICRDCGDLVGGVVAGQYVRWTECGCKNRPAPKPHRLFGTHIREVLSLFRRRR